MSIYIEYNGKTKNITQWANEFGMSDTCLKKKLCECGMDLKKALEYEGKKRGAKGEIFEFDGKKGNIYFWAKELGLDYTTIYKRLRKGWHLKDVFGKTKKGKHIKALGEKKDFKKIYSLNGEVGNLTYWAKKININPSSLMRRLNSWPLEKALSYNKGSGISYSRVLEWKGKKYSIKEFCKKFNLKYSAANSRLSLGWDVKKILKTPVRKYNKRK